MRFAIDMPCKGPADANSEVRELGRNELLDPGLNRPDPLSSEEMTVSDLPIPPQELKQAFLRKAQAVAHWALQQFEQYQEQPDLHFESPTPVQAIDFEIPSSAENEKNFKHLTSASLRALVIDLPFDQKARLQHLWEASQTDTQKREEFNALSRKIAEQIAKSPRFGDDRAKWRDQITLPLGITPPGPSTEYKLVAVGVKNMHPGFQLAQEETNSK